MLLLLLGLLIDSLAPALGRLVVADSTAGGGAKHGMVACHVARNPAYRSAR